MVRGVRATRPRNLRFAGIPLKSFLVPIAGALSSVLKKTGEQKRFAIQRTMDCSSSQRFTPSPLKRFKKLISTNYVTLFHPFPIHAKTVCVRFLRRTSMHVTHTVRIFVIERTRIKRSCRPPSRLEEVKKRLLYFTSEPNN